MDNFMVTIYYGYFVDNVSRGKRYCYFPFHNKKSSSTAHETEKNAPVNRLII